MKEALNALIQWYRTGEDGDRAAYDIAWVQDKDSPVDTINGFIEVYMDPRGHKGSWEALVYFVNREKTEDIRKLTNAQWFEDRMPWADQVQEAGRPRHHRQRHRRRHRDRRLRPITPVGSTCRTIADQGEARQQVGVALERQRGLRQVDVRLVPRVRLDRGGGAARGEVEQRRQRADHEHARGDRARLGQGLRRS